MASVTVASVLLTLGCTPGSGGPPEAPSAFRPLDPPAGPGAMAHRLSRGPQGVFATWLEPTEVGHALRVSRLDGERWSTPVEIAAGNDFFANWADTPGLLPSTDDAIVAFWLAKLGAGTYAYGVRTAHSDDGGATWTMGPWLHDDTSETEHGFVAGRPWRDGAVATWLDGRATAAGQPMQLRATRVVGGEPVPSTLLAPSVCDCCPTAMALAEDGPLVAFRGRTANEIRDIGVVRFGPDGWQPPDLVHADDWNIAGCPVNGPAIDAEDRTVAVAWFTAARGRAKVQVAFSEDGGGSFGTPMILDDAEPIGRVGLALGPGGAWVSWLAKRTSGEGVVTVAHVAASGLESRRLEVATVTTARAAGVPRLLRDGDRLLVSWLEGEPSMLRTAALSLSGTRE